ncbi:hypothetical protein SK128_015339, partial [Halocaridina rubra]
HVSSNAVDGDDTTQYHSTRTTAYWYIDLENIYLPLRIEILPISGRFNEVQVSGGIDYLGNDDFSNFKLITTVSASSRFDITLPGTECYRYLLFNRTDGYFLNIKEVAIFV